MVCSDIHVSSVMIDFINEKPMSQQSDQIVDLVLKRLDIFERIFGNNTDGLVDLVIAKPRVARVVADIASHEPKYITESFKNVLLLTDQQACLTLFANGDRNPILLDIVTSIFAGPVGQLPPVAVMQEIVNNEGAFDHLRECIMRDLGNIITSAKWRKTIVEVPELMYFVTDMLCHIVQDTGRSDYNMDAVDLFTTFIENKYDLFWNNYNDFIRFVHFEQDVVSIPSLQIPNLSLSLQFKLFMLLVHHCDQYDHKKERNIFFKILRQLSRNEKILECASVRDRFSIFRRVIIPMFSVKNIWKYDEKFTYMTEFLFTFCEHPLRDDAFIPSLNQFMLWTEEHASDIQALLYTKPKLRQRWITEMLEADPLQIEKYLAMSHFYSLIVNVIGFQIGDTDSRNMQVLDRFLMMLRPPSAVEFKLVITRELLKALCQNVTRGDEIAEISMVILNVLQDQYIGSLCNALAVERNNVPL